MRFADEEYLVRAGEDGCDVYLVVRGSCLVENREATPERQPGHEVGVVHGDDAEPAFVGEMAYLGGGCRTASVRSAMNTFALRLTPAHIDTIIERFPLFTRILCRQFARRLRVLNERLRHYQAQGLLQAEQRFLAPDETLCEQGAPANHLFELVDGALTQTAAGEEREIMPGAGISGFLEAPAYLACGRYATSLRAKTQCIVVAIHADSRENVVRNYPELALRCLQHAVKE